MNSAPVPRSTRSAVAGRPGVCVITLLLLCAFLGMSLDPYASDARGAEPRPAVSTVPEPAGEGHHDTAMGAQTASARAGRGAGPSTRTERRASRPPYPGAVAPSNRGPVTPPTARRVVLRC